MRPTVAALMEVPEREIVCKLVLVTLQLPSSHVLEAGSWRTRHFRVRGTVMRHALQVGSWKLSHLDGVFMPADLGTQAIDPAQLGSRTGYVVVIFGPHTLTNPLKLLVQRLLLWKEPKPVLRRLHRHYC